MQTTETQTEMHKILNRELGAHMVRESAYKIKELPERLRPSSELERLGAEHISDVTCLALILTGNGKVNSLDLARELLSHYGTLSELRKVPVEELQTWTGMTEKQAVRLVAALELGARMSEEQLPDRPRIVSPADAARVLRDKITGDCETFAVLALDTKNRVIGEPVMVSKGLLDASLVHPREVFRSAIRRNSAGVVLAHNHPSGDPTPSAEDIRITRQLVAAGKIIDISVMDHVIIGSGDKFLSLREEGVVEF